MRIKCFSEFVKNVWERRYSLNIADLVNGCLCNKLMDNESNRLVFKRRKTKENKSNDGNAWRDETIEKRIKVQRKRKDKIRVNWGKRSWKKLYPAVG